MRSLYSLMIVLAALVLITGCGAPKPAPAPQSTAQKAVAPESAVSGSSSEEEVPQIESVKEAPDSEEAAATETAEDAAPAPAGSAPKLVVPEPEYDFGKMDNSEMVEHGFLIRNEGGSLLKIESVRASCGCTTTALKKKELEPGEELIIQANTNLKGRQGPQTKAITIFSNDPENPNYRLTIKGEAIASISLDPMNVSFGRIEDDEPREATVTIKSNKEDVNFTVRSAEVDGMTFIQQEVKEVVPGKEYQMVVKTQPQLPEGHHNGRIIIRTDSTERPVIWLTVSMQVIGALQIMPPLVNLRYTEEEGAVETQQISLTKGRISEFEITDVILPLDSMEHELIKAAPNVYRLVLKNMPRNDALEGKRVVVKTNREDYPEVYIPFNIYRPKLQSIPPQKVTDAAKSLNAAIVNKEIEEAIEANE